MSTVKQRFVGFIATLSMAALILDAQTALDSAKEAIDLCISVLIPSLFPFFICSYLLTSAASGGLRIMKPLCLLLRIPSGSEAILAVGLLGGYPAGAQAIATACSTGALDRNCGRRMLAFCNNAGPAFFFGIGMQIFRDVRICLICWLIHISGALLVGILTPGDHHSPHLPIEATPITLTLALQKALRTMAAVCGWVVIMRIFMGLLEHWLLWRLSPAVGSILCGILELSSGCCSLIENSDIGVAFILFSAYTAFGGICVWLQTLSVTANHIHIAAYLPGKITHTAISILFAWPLQFFLGEQIRCIVPVWILLPCILWCVYYSFFFVKRKIPVEITGNMVYNQANASGGLS